IFDRVRVLYGRVLDVTLSVRWSMALGAILIAAGAVPLYKYSAKELAPTEDEGGVFFVLNAAPDASLDANRRATKEITSGLAKVPENRFVCRVLFTSTGFGGMQTVNWDERERTTKEILPEAFGIVSGVSGMRAFPMLPP